MPPSTAKEEDDNDERLCEALLSRTGLVNPSGTLAALLNVLVISGVLSLEDAASLKWASFAKDDRIRPPPID